MFTMSLCSRFALLARSSFTTSTWPSLEAEISAVQQSYIQDKKLIRSLTKMQDTPFLADFERFRTYQLVIPSSHECPNAMDNNAQWSVRYCTISEVCEILRVCVCWMSSPSHLLNHNFACQLHSSAGHLLLWVNLGESSTLVQVHPQWHHSRTQEMTSNWAQFCKLGLVLSVF